MVVTPVEWRVVSLEGSRVESAWSEVRHHRPDGKQEQKKEE